LDDQRNQHSPETKAGSTEPRTGRLSVRDARRAADEAQACYRELQRRNDTMIERRRDAIDRGDLMQSHRLTPEHQRIVLQLRNAAHKWNLAVARLLDAELNERGY
jgi:hypothetical protein